MVTHSGGEERAGLKLLQTHGAGVSAKEQDEGHEGDVRDKLAGFPHQLSFVLQALCLCEGRPCGVHWLHRGNKEHQLTDNCLRLSEIKMSRLTVSQ